MNVPQLLPGVSAHTGFPNAAIDESLQAIDLNKILIKHRVSTYFMRIRSGAWEHLHILNGDVLLIDKALKALPNDLVVWYQDDGTFCISALHKVDQNEATIWGVISSVIHCLRDPS